jgi:hypothetical protein
MNLVTVRKILKPMENISLRTIESIISRPMLFSKSGAMGLIPLKKRFGFKMT